MNKTTIALADDHEEFRKGLHDFLTMHNFEVIYHKPDGAELVQEMSSNGRLPDICILDLDMTNQNGIVTAQQIHNRWPHIKIILYTMALIPALGSELAGYGVTKYLPKGRNPSFLIDALKELSSA
jgi:DNA-binding NarL/FixJ family response regulator